MFRKSLAALSIPVLSCSIFLSDGLAQTNSDTVTSKLSGSNVSRSSKPQDAGHELRVWRAQYKMISRTLEQEYNRSIGFDPSRPIVSESSMYSAPSRPRYYISAPIGPSLYYGPSFQRF